jgi:hypothetical protein
LSRLALLKRDPVDAAATHPNRVFAPANVGEKFSRGFDQCGQATKGAWGMSWRQKAMKGVEVCEKLGGVDKRALIPRYPN